MLIIGGIVSHKKDMSGTFGDKFNPWWGTKMPYEMKHRQKMKKKKKILQLSDKDVNFKQTR